MGTNSQVMTQNSLLSLNAALEQLASNLSIHVNESLSIAHGLNASMINYYDSFGDQWGNVVIVFEFGTPPNVTRLYVPAQITTLGPASTGSGLVVTSTSPSGTFTAPGVPLSHKPLVTEITSESETQAVIHDEMLLGHANTVHSDTGASQCHGGQSYTNGVVSDTLSHQVGRKYITIGYRGTSFKLPCETYVNSDGTVGPPQLMRGINLVANRTTLYNTGACKAPYPQLGAFWLTGYTGGSLPYTVTYETSLSSDGSGPWVQLTNTAVGWHPSGNVKGFNYDISYPGVLQVQCLETHEGGYLQQLTVRARITNDAGDVITNYCRFYSSQPKEDDCWFDNIFGTDWFTDVESNNQASWNESIPGSPALQP